MKPLANYFCVKTKILKDFHICISVPLIIIITTFNVKSECLDRAYILQKIHNNFSNTSSFQPLLDTTSTIHDAVEKLHLNLLDPLYIYSTPLELKTKSTKFYVLFEKGFQCVSLFIISLCTNVLLKCIITIILERVQKDQPIKANLKIITLISWCLEENILIQ